ncbi:hypothetical protein Ahy_A02g008910 [Arachis hypogaea]|uniref:Ubiquitin-like protease family profile domain-containing protein n=1 Tax=Arachis hypogaea TaxID=3818 RepID=A0A445EFG6_ARAHY|nr:hypothetical protein Ahy_A02g008910 [Arachis hypogaea]
MSEEKKIIVRDLGFGGLMHIPPLMVHHQILRELANSFKLGENRLETGYGSFKVRPKTIEVALGINASEDLFPQKVNYKDLSEDDKEFFRRFQGKILKNLTDEMMAIAVDNEQYHLMFKRIFILYIQMAFLLPTTINKISPVHLAPIFEMDTITEWNWGGHVLSFIIKGVIDYKLKKKKAIDSCLFVLMIIYFHLSKNKDKKRAEKPPESWIANWTKEQLVERMRAEIEEHMSETEEDSEDSTKKQSSQKVKKIQSKKKKIVVEDSSTEQAQSYHGSEIGTEDLDEFLRKNNKKSATEREKEADLRSTEGHYVSSEIIPDVNLGSDDPSSQGHTEQSSVNKPVESMVYFRLSLVEKSVSEPVEENMMVVREETPSEGLAISNSTLLNPPQQLEESTPTLPPAPSKINPVSEDATALMMMAQTASYVPKTDPMSSFSLGLIDSSQEETATLQAQDRYTLSKLHLASLAPEMHIEAEIVSAMCFILNQQKIKRFQEEVYCLPPDIVNMAIANHPHGVFLQPKNNNPFRVEDYPMFIPFLDLKKFAPHRYIFAPVCHSQHWWLWLADTRKRKFYIVDPYHTKSPFDERTTLNTFIYMLGAPLKSRDKDKEIEPLYLHISGKKTSYDCTIYVMKWLEIFEPTNIKRRKYEWDNWTQHEVDHFRVEYASRILFHDMNLDKAEAIRESNGIRLSKPSSLLLSPYCQIDSKDIDTD